MLLNCYNKYDIFYFCIMFYQNESFLPFSLCRNGAMDVDNSCGTDQGFSKSYEKTESHTPERTTFRDKIGVAEIYSWQVRGSSQQAFFWVHLRLVILLFIKSI